MLLHLQEYNHDAVAYVHPTSFKNKSRIAKRKKEKNNFEYSPASTQRLGEWSLPLSANITSCNAAQTKVYFQTENKTRFRKKGKPGNTHAAREESKLIQGGR